MGAYAADGTTSNLGLGAVWQYKVYSLVRFPVLLLTFSTAVYNCLALCACMESLALRWGFATELAARGFRRRIRIRLDILEDELTEHDS